MLLDFRIITWDANIGFSSLRLQNQPTRLDSDSTMHFNTVSSWVVIDGKYAEEYNVEQSEIDGIPHLTCWISSQLGKASAEKCFWLQSTDI